MPHRCKGPPGGAPGEPKELHSFNRECQTNSPPDRQKQVAITALQRDFAAEALRVAAIKASHAAEDIELGDDICAERGISIVIDHVKAAASTFREIQNAGAKP